MTEVMTNVIALCAAEKYPTYVNAPQVGPLDAVVGLHVDGQKSLEAYKKGEGRPYERVIPFPVEDAERLHAYYEQHLTKPLAEDAFFNCFSFVYAMKGWGEYTFPYISLPAYSGVYPSLEEHILDPAAPLQPYQSYGVVRGEPDGQRLCHGFVSLPSLGDSHEHTLEHMSVGGRLGRLYIGRDSDMFTHYRKERISRLTRSMAALSLRWAIGNGYQLPSQHRT